MEDSLLEGLSVMAKKESSKGHSETLLIKWERQGQKPCGTFRGKNEINWNINMHVPKGRIKNI